MEDSQAVSKGEKDFLSGTMSTSSEADKNFLGFSVLEVIIDEARDSSSPHNQKRWKFGITYQQVLFPFFPPCTLAWWFASFFGTFLVQL